MIVRIGALLGAHGLFSELAARILGSPQHHASRIASGEIKRLGYQVDELIGISGSIRVGDVVLRHFQCALICIQRAGGIDERCCETAHAVYPSRTTLLAVIGIDRDTGSRCRIVGGRIIGRQQARQTRVKLSSSPEQFLHGSNRSPQRHNFRLDLAPCQTLARWAISS